MRDCTFTPDAGPLREFTVAQQMELDGLEDRAEALAALPQSPVAQTIALSAPLDPLSDLPALGDAVALAREEKDEADFAYALAAERHAREGEPAFAACCGAAQRRIDAHNRLAEARAALRAACLDHADSFDEEPF